jgi:hypothetical protein
MARPSLDGEYSPAEIWAGAQDDHGHSAYMRLPFPKSWMGQIGDLVGSNEWPEYSSPQAFVRDAIWHRLHWVSKQTNRKHAEDTAMLLAKTHVENQLARWARDHEAASEISKTIAEHGERAIAVQDESAFQDLLSEMEDYVRLHIRPPYLDRLLSEINTWRKRTDAYR